MNLVALAQSLSFIFFKMSSVLIHYNGPNGGHGVVIAKLISRMLVTFDVEDSSGR